MKQHAIIFVLIALLAGCSDHSGDSAEKPAGNNVFKDKVERLDKARAVEQQLQDAAKKQRHNQAARRVVTRKGVNSPARTVIFQQLAVCAGMDSCCSFCIRAGM